LDQPLPLAVQRQTSTARREIPVAAAHFLQEDSTALGVPRPQCPFERIGPGAQASRRIMFQQMM
jgi:hypothetical protein